MSTQCTLTPEEFIKLLPQEVHTLLEAIVFPLEPFAYRFDLLVDDIRVSIHKDKNKPHPFIEMISKSVPVFSSYLNDMNEARIERIQNEELKLTYLWVNFNEPGKPSHTRLFYSTYSTGRVLDMDFYRNKLCYTARVNTQTDSVLYMITEDGNNVQHEMLVHPSELEEEQMFQMSTVQDMEPYYDLEKYLQRTLKALQGIGLYEPGR